MTIANMRAWVTSVYPNNTWAEKVRNMSDEQVTAMFIKFQRQGKIKC